MAASSGIASRRTRALLAAGLSLTDAAAYNSTMRDPVTALGYLAGVFTTAAFIPQLVRARRSRSTKDLSLPMFLIFTTGVVLWLVYGIAIRSAPVIAANGVTLVLAGAILALKIRHG
jgi:MtN3 and saliva related transmembrane protein